MQRQCNNLRMFEISSIMVFYEEDTMDNLNIVKHDKKYDFITIGSATLDVFVETPEARIVSVYTQEHKNEFMAYPYGSKVDIDNFAFEIGGGALNTALNFKNLGFKTATIVKIGDDPMAKAIQSKLLASGVESSYVVQSTTEKSGLSVILTSFQGDRTVLAHRGTNATLKASEINFEAIENSKWLYLAPLNGESTLALDEIAKFAEEKNVDLAINLGTSSMKKCKENLAEILKTAEIVLMNCEEAQMLTGLSIRPNSAKEDFSKCVIHPDIITILDTIKQKVGGIVVVTDGKRGVYANDGQKYYCCGEFPAKPVSTLGAGDAFASTFTAVYAESNDIEKALKYASVNAASVVENFGAQKGFLTFDEIAEKLEKNPEFVVKVI